MPQRIVVVTGAKGGLGKFVTRKFLEAGEMVVGVSRTIRASDFPNANFLPVELDLNDADAIRELADSVVQRFGHIDVMAHLVGGFAGGTPLHETDSKTWSLMQDQNLTSAFNVARAVVPHMRKEGRGRLILVGSKAAEQPRAQLGAYVIFKSALITLVKTLAMENADRGVTINAVLPGTMDTAANRAAMPAADKTKWVNPMSVADVIFWLSGSDAAQTNGAAIPVSGMEG